MIFKIYKDTMFVEPGDRNGFVKTTFIRLDLIDEDNSKIKREVVLWKDRKKLFSTIYELINKDNNYRYADMWIDYSIATKKIIETFKPEKIIM